MPDFEVSADWKRTYPEALVGVLAMEGVENPERHQGLDQKKEELERSLRDRYADLDRKALRQIPALAAYHAYYKQFGKTYHVQHQLESIVFKDKQIPRVAALVEAMFMAELKNFLLTAGHDLEAIEGSLTVQVAAGDETYELMNGQQQTLKTGDMLIRDRAGVVSSIMYGPDRRTRITPATERVVYTVYGPPGIGRPALQLHLEDIRDNVRLVAPEAGIELMQIYGRD